MKFEKFKENTISNISSSISIWCFISSFILEIILIPLNIEYSMLVLLIPGIFISGIFAIISSIFSIKKEYSNNFYYYCIKTLDNEYKVNNLIKLRDLIINNASYNGEGKLIILNYPDDWKLLMTKLNERIKTLKYDTN